MKILVGCFVFTVLVAWLAEVGANQDVDGTIVWVNNDKKEKEITVGKPKSSDLEFWKIADNRIDDVDIEDRPKSQQKPSLPLFVGDEDTPVKVGGHKHKASAQDSDTVDAEFISDEESPVAEYSHELKGDSHQSLDHSEEFVDNSKGFSDDSKEFRGNSQTEGGNSQVIGGDVSREFDDHSEHFASSSKRINGGSEELGRASENAKEDVNIFEGERPSTEDNSFRTLGAVHRLDVSSPGIEDNSKGIEGLGQAMTVKNGNEFSPNTNGDSEFTSEPEAFETPADEVGQGKSHVVKASKKKTKSHSPTEKVIASLVEAEDGEITVKGEAKTNIGKHVDNPNEKNFEKAKKMLYDGMNMKRDDISQFGPEEEGSIRGKLGVFAPDDGDISSILSRYTDHKTHTGHRMGNDELQMHLDDEALKMQVKAIEEEDGNVKSVLQGSDRFINFKKLGHLEGDIEKDLIKSIGKNGLEIEGNGIGSKSKELNGGKRYHFDKKDDEEDEEAQERSAFKDENDDDDDDEGDDESVRENDESKSKKPIWKEEDHNTEDENGDRKDLVSKHSGEEMQSNPSKSKHPSKKYNFYGPTGKLNISPTDEANMGVNIDNQVMESEIKEIEKEDVKVSDELQSIGKDGKKIELEEYNFDTPTVAATTKHFHRQDDDLGSGEEDNVDIHNKLADLKHKARSDYPTKSSNSELSEEIREMLRETSKVLKETNSVIDEGHAVTHKTKEILDSVLHDKKYVGSDARTVSNKTDVTPSEANAQSNETNSMLNDANSTSRETNAQLNETNSMRNESNATSSETNAMASESNATVNETIVMPNVTINTNSTSGKNASFVKNNTTLDRFMTSENVENSAKHRNSTIHPNKNATASSNIASVKDADNRTSSIGSDIDGKVFTNSSEEFNTNLGLQTPSKRDLERTDDNEFNFIIQKLKKMSNSSKRHMKSRRHHKHKVSKYGNKKYTKSELKILNLMFKSPMFTSVRGHIAKFKAQNAEKRSSMPNVKTTYRRYKKQRSSGMRGRFTKNRSPVNGKKRGGVDAGMTGAMTYTNRDGNEFMFAVSNQLLTWSQSNKKCRSLGGELLSIGDKEEQEFIQSNVIQERTHYWIGFTDQENEGTWQWTDRTPVRYSNWSNLEPDDGNIKSGQATHNEDCAVINPTMDWSDVPCWNRFPFVCKFLPDNGHAISFGGTLSHSDVGNKQDDEFAQGLKTNKNLPQQRTKKPVIEGSAKTRAKEDTMMNKGYNGQGPSRGGDKALMSQGKSAGAKNLHIRQNSAMAKGAEAGVKGGAEAMAGGSSLAKGASVMEAGKNGLKQVASALNKASKNLAEASKPAMATGNQGAKFGPGSTGLGAIPGASVASANGNAGLGKIGGVENSGASPAQVQQGGNGGQSGMNSGNQAPAGGGGIQGGGNGAPGGGGGATGGGGGVQGGGGGAPTGGGGGPAGGGGGPAGGGGAPAGGGGAPAGGGGAPAGGGGAPAGGGGAPVGGGGAPAGGGGGPAGGGGAPVGGGGAPAGGGGAPAGGGGGGVPNQVMQGSGPAIVTPNPTVGMSGTPTVMESGGTPTVSGGGPQLSPEQAMVAKELANQIAPKLAKEYAQKFEPDMEMIQTICGKFCSDTAMAIPGDDPAKLGKVCGRICAESLMKMSPAEVMGVLGGLGKAAPTKPMAAVPSVVQPVPAPGGIVALPNSLPVGNSGGSMNNGDNRPVGGGSNGGGSNGGGSNDGGSNGGGSNGGGSNGGGSNGGGSPNSGGSAGGGPSGGSSNSGGSSGSPNSAANNGVGAANGGVTINLGDKGLNLQTLGSLVASNLGLNVEGNGKVTALDGQNLKEKASEAIDDIKSQTKIKTNTASKSSTPDVDATEQLLEKIKGYYLLKQTDNGFKSVREDQQGPTSKGYVIGTKRAFTKTKMKIKKKRIKNKKKKHAKNKKNKFKKIKKKNVGYWRKIEKQN